MERTREGVLGVIVKEEKYLLGVEAKDRPWKGQWRLIGGGMEVEENHEKTLRREVGEETSIAIDELKYLGTMQGDRRTLHIYEAKWVSGELTPKEDEVSEIGWFPLEKVRELLPELEEVTRRVFLAHYLNA